MPIFFVGYALLVWFFAARYRRQLQGFLAVFLGFAGLMALNWLHLKFSAWSKGEIYLPVLQSLMYPYTALVAGIGAYIWCLPRVFSRGCRRCGYDLESLLAENPACVCPECGTPQAIEPRPLYRPSGTERADVAASDAPGEQRLAADDPQRQTEHEDEDAGAEDEAEPQGLKAAG